MNWTKSRNGNLIGETVYNGNPVKIEIYKNGTCFKGYDMKYDPKNYHDGFYDYPIIFSGTRDNEEETKKYIDTLIGESEHKEPKKKNKKVDKIKNSIELPPVLGENDTVITIDTQGADKVKYTTDGRDITQFSKVYKDPIIVPRGIILKIKRYFEDGRIEDEEIEVK